MLVVAGCHYVDFCWRFLGECVCVGWDGLRTHDELFWAAHLLGYVQKSYQHPLLSSLITDPVCQCYHIDCWPGTLVPIDWVVFFCVCGGRGVIEYYHRTSKFFYSGRCHNVLPVVTVSWYWLCTSVTAGTTVFFGETQIQRNSGTGIRTTDHWITLPAL